MRRSEILTLASVGPVTIGAIMESTGRSFAEVRNAVHRMVGHTASYHDPGWIVWGSREFDLEVMTLREKMKIERSGIPVLVSNESWDPNRAIFFVAKEFGPFHDIVRGWPDWSDGGRLQWRKYLVACALGEPA